MEYFVKTFFNRRLFEVFVFCFYSGLADGVFSVFVSFKTILNAAFKIICNDFIFVLSGRFNVFFSAFSGHIRIVNHYFGMCFKTVLKQFSFFVSGIQQIHADPDVRIEKKLLVEGTFSACGNPDEYDDLHF